jgi:nitroreductase
LRESSFGGEPLLDFEMVVKKRRMCREYSDKDVPQEKVDRILDIASRYPSAGHTEPQEFIVVRDQRVKENLAHAALDQTFVAQAPLAIVIISDVRRSAQRYGERGVRFFSIIDGAFVAMLVLLAVVNEGLGACFVGSFYDEEVQEVLSLPQHVRPIGIIPIGYCTEEPRKFPRRSRSQIVQGGSSSPVGASLSEEAYVTLQTVIYSRCSRPRALSTEGIGVAPGC